MYGSRVKSIWRSLARRPLPPRGDDMTASLLDIVPLEDPDDITCMTFVLKGEDHTLGNALRHMIMKNPEVTFCGYSVPHPSEHKINLRIQTNGIAATEALRKGLQDLEEMCQHILHTFKESTDDTMDSS